MKIALFFVLAVCPLVRAATPVWIDTDPSVKRGGHEVDDGYALVQAFRSPELAVRGVSVVFGNAPLAEAYPIGQEFVRVFGPAGMPVHKGAAGAADLGVETAASKAIAEALRRERLTILVLGPATNVATVVKRHPELASRIRSVIAVAGRRPGQKFQTSEAATPFRDFNFELDAEAFRVLLDARVPMVLAPWEISSKVWLGKAELDSLRATDPRLGSLLDASEDWLDRWKKNSKTTGFNPFDTLAVGYAISPRGFGCDAVAMSIEVLPDDTGRPGSKPYFVTQKTGSIRYCHTPPHGFAADLLRRLGNKPAGAGTE